MSSLPRNIFYRTGCFAVLVLSALTVACGSGDGGMGGGTGGKPSNHALFTFACDIGGVTAVLKLEVEAVGVSGLTFGSGPNPEITGVIGTGQVNYYTAGELRSPTALYSFTGTNDFADFVDLNRNERFVVRWQATSSGLVMVVNPFGPGPVQYQCTLTGARYL